MIRKFTNLLKSNPPPSDNRQPSSLELKVESAETVTAKKNWPQALRSWQALLDEFGKSPKTPEETLRHIRFNISLLKRLVDIKSYKAKIKAHGSKPRPGPGRIAIYTSFTKGYDNLLPPEVIDERFDYIVFTDHQPDGFGLFDVRPLPEPNHDDARAIRYPKTHAHLLFKGYDAAVWVDTSFMIIGDLWPLIKAYMASGRPIGSSDHPYRKTLHQEFEACAARGKDDYAALKQQIDFYDSIGFETNDLSENSVLMFNLKNPQLVKQLAPAMETWWQQILRFSKRDQLSFNYALATNGVERYHLVTQPMHIRIHPALVFVPHSAKPAILDEFYKALSS